MTTLQFMTYVWIAVAVLSWIAEVSIPNFAFVFSSLAALVAALTATFGIRWEVQALAFVASLFVGLFLLRPRMVRRLQSKRHLPSRTDSLIGKKALVTEEIHPESGGRVEIDGLCWSARAPSVIHAGAQVTVENADGIVLLVKKK